MNMSAISLVGIKVLWKDLFETQLVPGCNHIHTHKFCPECGSPAKETKNVRIFAEDAEYDSGKIALYGLQMYRPYEADFAFLGVILGCASDDNYAERTAEPFAANSAWERVKKAKANSKFEAHRIIYWTILDVSP